MRKRIFPRIIWFTLLNCVIFILLVAMQFTRSGNFSFRIGDMLVNGRYALETDDALSTPAPPSPMAPSQMARALNGGANVFFGGLEFRLASAAYITIGENGATFILPDETELSFGTPDTPELRITAKFPNDADGGAGGSAAGSSAAVEIPFRMQRSALIHDGGSDAILYRGSRYQFSRPVQGFESGYLVLAAAAPSVSYRTVTDKKEFIPADFIAPQAETAQAFSGVLARWVSRNYALWGHMGTHTDEDTVIAWCGEAIRQGNYRAASTVVPISFSSDPHRTWESAVYQFDRRIGVWERAARAVSVFEREKNTRLTRLLAQKDSALFTEKHLVEFLTIRGSSDLINNLLSFARELDPAVVALEMVPGILESSLDMHKWHPDADDPFAPLAEQVIQLVAHDLHRDGDRVFVFANGHADIEFNLRLGTAIYKWGEMTGNNEWAGVGRSLALSVISLSNDSGSAPAVLTSGETHNETGARVSSARLYRILSDNDHLPHAAATGANGIWAWTAATAVTISRTETQMNISIRFPVGETHYVMLYNVPPFPLLQIYDVSWRRAVDFESYYNSSGWYYFEQDRILVVKINQRSNTENVRIYFTVPRAPEPEPQVQPETQNQAEPQY